LAIFINNVNYNYTLPKLARKLEKGIFIKIHNIMTKNLLLTGLILLCLSCAKNTENQNLSEWDPEARLIELDIALPEASAPVANYVNAVRSGNLLFLAGKGPGNPDGSYITGKVGQELSVEQGRDAARLVAINHLGVLKAELGDLKRVKRIIKVLGMVNCGPEFQQQPQVINGYSDLMVEVFGEKGKHARSAVGMIALPMNIAVEVEVIVEIED
jgi:enamine deaminase RidA (YjgF/YER057c/UK114 family)